MIPSKPTDDFETLLEAFVQKLNVSAAYSRDEYQTVLDCISKLEDETVLTKVARAIFTSDYITIPPELGIAILRRFVHVSRGSALAKAYLGQWLAYCGMEYENSEEGIRLIQETDDPIMRETPWKV